MSPDESPRVRLYPGQWVQLPGTDWQVYLHGKPGQEGVEIVRTHLREEFGGWDLEPIFDHVYTRKAPP